MPHRITSAIEELTEVVQCLLGFLRGSTVKWKDLIWAIGGLTGLIGSLFWIHAEQPHIGAAEDKDVLRLEHKIDVLQESIQDLNTFLLYTRERDKHPSQEKLKR